MNLAEKKEIVERLHDRLLRSSIVIVTDYKGLNVTTINDLRRKLKDENVELQVVKNTLLTRASAETEVHLIADHFKGPTAVALGYDDPVVPAKILMDFAKDNEQLAVKAGVLNGRVLTLAEIKALAALPSRDRLLATLLSVINGVPTALVRTLSAIPQKLLFVLCALKNQKQAA